MDGLRDLQQAFLGHLLGEGSPIVGAIESTADASVAARLSIYATGYRLRLKEALETDYPRLHAYLGDTLFDRLADAYIDRYRSHGTSLRGYSRHMGELLGELPPFSDLPVLGEIERIERAFNHSFDAADRPPPTPGLLEQMPPAAWPGMRPILHPSVTLLPLRYNSFAIWQALANETQPPEPTEAPTTWLIWRRSLVSRYRALPAPEAEVLHAIRDGEPFGTLCERLLEHFAAEAVPREAVLLLQSWLTEQVVATLDWEATPPS